MLKRERLGTLGKLWELLKIRFFKIENKMKGGPFGLETIKDLRKKSHKAKITCTKKVLGQGRDSNNVLLLALRGQSGNCSIFQESRKVVV